MRNQDMQTHYFSSTYFIKCSLIQLCFLFLLDLVGTIDPCAIFQEYFADICDAIEAKPLHIVNWLFSAKLISLSFKKDVQSMSSEPYEIANKTVDELQRQVDEKGMEFLKSICDFLLKQNQMLKNIGMKIKHQLESKSL